MENVRSKHVDSIVLHIRCFNFALDRLFHRWLAMDLRRYISTFGTRNCDTLVGTGKCKVARKSRTGWQGYQDFEEIREVERDWSTWQCLQKFQGNALDI